MEALTRKVGGLPVWAWVGVLVVGYLAYKRYAASKANAQQTTAAQNVLANAFGNITGAPYAGWQGGASSPGQGAAGTSPGSGAGSPGTTSTPTADVPTSGTTLVSGYGPVTAAPTPTQANTVPAGDQVVTGNVNGMQFTTDTATLKAEGLL